MPFLPHLRAVVALPLQITVVVPLLILMLAGESDTRWGFGMPWYLLPFATGLVLLTAGLVLLAVTVRLFATTGHGTLAPWDPTRRLVVRGPYRFVRNPMISGVALILAGETIWFGSILLAGIVLLFVVLNHLYFVLSEEPGLTRRFGDEYREYRRHVPRWIPRITPWQPGSGAVVE